MQFIKASDLARYLNITVASVYNYARQGIIPSGVKIGKSRRWDLDEVKAFIEMRKEIKEI